MKNCVISAMEKRGCSDDAVQEALFLYEEYGASQVSRFCGEVIDENSDACKRLTLPDRPPKSRRSRSPFFPLMKILTTL